MQYYSNACIQKTKNLAITLACAKEYLKILHDYEDDLITSLIKSVTLKFERYTSRALITQKWQTTYRQIIRENISLPVKPIKKIVNVYTINQQGKSQLYPSEHYYLNDELQEIFFKIFPLTYLIKIEYESGYGNSMEDIPEDIVSTLLYALGYEYENRDGRSTFDYNIFNEFKEYKF